MSDLLDEKWLNKKVAFSEDIFLDFLIKIDNQLKKYVAIYARVMSHKIICTFVPEKKKKEPPPKRMQLGYFEIKKVVYKLKKK